MQQEVKALNGLIETISQKMIDKTINDRYLISRMAVIVNEFDPVTNSASIIIPTDLHNPTTYKYPNRTGRGKLNSTVWEDGAIKTYGDKVYLIYQTNNISQGWLESNEALVMDAGTIDYNQLQNRPQINGVTLEGDKTSDDFYLQDELVSGTNIKTINNNSLLGSGNVAVQDVLVSGTNIKTLNNNSILGSGDMTIDKSFVGLGNVDNTSDVNKPISIATQTVLDGKQAMLVSGTNIKTLNNNSILGSGNLDIAPKFVKGTPIDLYDTDGETVLYSRNPENLVFYDGDSGQNVASNFIYANPSADVTLSTSYINITNLRATNSRGTGFEISGGQIKCNKNGRVKVIIVGFVYSSGGRDFYQAIGKNGVNQNWGVIYNYNYSNHITNTMVLDVVAGDIINVRAYATSSGATYRSASQIICEYIEDYYITQAISESNTYSSSEIEVGRWIDGRPIYRKCFTVSQFPNNTELFIPTGIQNVDYLVALHGMETNGAECFVIPAAWNTSYHDACTFVLTGANAGSLRVHTTSDRRSYSGFICIDYVKTTD